MSESDLPSATLPSVSLPIGMDIKSILVSAGDLGVWKRPAHVVTYERAVRCFRRAMRRHKKRAVAQGLEDCVGHMRAVQHQCLHGIDTAENAARCSRILSEDIPSTVAGDDPNGGRRRRHGRHFRFFYGLMADALQKLATAHRAYQEADARYDASAFSFGTLDLVNPRDMTLHHFTPFPFGDGAGNRILCPACFRRLYPAGHEQKSCTHGCGEATCVECGVKRRLDEPYWACLG